MIDTFFRSMRSSASFLRATLLFLTIFSTKTFAQDFGFMETQQELFQQNRHLGESMENLPQGVVGEEWGEHTKQDFQEAEDLLVGQF